MGNGTWTSCGCSTLYTDAWGNPINGPGADGAVASTNGACKIDWGLVALIAIAAIAGMSVAGSSRK